MQFLKDIRAHLNNFETDAQDKIHAFLDFLDQKYAPPTEAKPGPVVTPTIMFEAPPQVPTVEIPPQTTISVTPVTTTESAVIAVVAPSFLTCIQAEK